MDDLEPFRLAVWSFENLLLLDGKSFSVQSDETRFQLQTSNLIGKPKALLETVFETVLWRRALVQTAETKILCKWNG